MRLRKARTLAPSQSPLTAAELRAFLSRTTSELADATANTWIAAAVDRTERWLDIAVMSQRWRMIIPGADEGRRALRDAYDHPFLLTPSPVQTVNFKVERNTGAGWQDVTSSFLFSAASQPARFRPKSDISQADFSAVDAIDGFCVTYQAGYDSPADVPEALRQGILHFAAFLLENAENNIEVAGGLESLSVDSITLKYGSTSRTDLYATAKQFLLPFSPLPGLGVF